MSRPQKAALMASFESLARDSQRISRGILTGDPERDQRNVSLLLATINAVNSTIDRREIIVRMVDMIVELCGAERGPLLLQDAEGEMRVAVGRDRDKQTLAEDPPYSRSSVRQAVLTHRPLCIVDTLEEDDVRFGASVHEMSLRTVMCVPLTARDENLGVMYADSKLAAKGFTGADLTVFEALCTQLAHILEAARLDRGMTRATASNAAKNRLLRP